MVLSLASSFSIKKLRPNDRPHHLSPIYFEFGPHRRQSKDSLSYSNLFNLEGNGLSDEHMHHDESAEHNKKRNLDVELNSIKEEERKLEETLEYQGQIEKEAK